MRLRQPASLQWLIGIDSNLGATKGSLTPPGDMANAGKVIVLEGILTFFLVIAVFASGVHGRNGDVAQLRAIGLVLTMDILFGGPLTGPA